MSQGKDLCLEHVQVCHILLTLVLNVKEVLFYDVYHSLDAC